MPRDETVKAIEAALERAPEVNLHRDHVRIEHNNALRLAGRVSDIRVKRRALSIAGEAAGGRDIEDALELETAVERKPDELRQAVVETLQQEPVFVETRICEGQASSGDTGDALAVETEGARVILRGHVASLGRHRLAEILAWWVPGVADVVNEIRVEPPEEDSDGALVDAVRVALEKDPTVPAGQIDIGAAGGHVTLSGAVDSDEQHRLAELACWYVPGVVGVTDALRVKTP